MIIVDISILNHSIEATQLVPIAIPEEIVAFDALGTQKERWLNFGESTDGQFVVCTTLRTRFLTGNGI
jgi:hypothetical protein